MTFTFFIDPRFHDRARVVAGLDYIAENYSNAKLLLQEGRGLRDWAAKAARARGIEVATYRPDRGHGGRADSIAGWESMVRKMVASAEKVFVFVTNKKSSTSDMVRRLSTAWHRPCAVIQERPSAAERTLNLFSKEWM